MMKIEKIGLEVELGVFSLRRPIVCDFLPWTKKKPLELGGTLYHKDASMFELALPPCSSGTMIDTEYAIAVARATSMLPPGAELVPVASANYTQQELDKDSYASILGCSSSLNIHGVSPFPDGYRDTKRYGGLHVNISSSSPMNGRTVLALDATLGLKSVLEWEQEDKEDIMDRRSMYGRAGEYRLKRFGRSYGLEYRTLPASSWSKTEGTTLWDTVSLAGEIDFKALLPYKSRIERAINTCSAPMAEKIIEELGYGI